MKICKLNTLWVGTLALLAYVSVAEARVCLLPFSDMCDFAVAAKVEATTVKHSCSKSFNLSEPITPDEDHYCMKCDKCTDEEGDHYRCNCFPKRTCDDMGLLTEMPQNTDKFVYECDTTTDMYGNICYDCRKECTVECSLCNELPNPDTCECERLPEKCANLCFKFKFTNYQPISKQECEEIKDELGIKYCINAEKDYFAGAVKACGGVDELPTEDEAFKLAQCMFDPNETYSSIYGYRYDGYFISYGGKGDDLKDHVYVWLNWERDRSSHNAIIRMYDYYGSIPYFAEKDGSLYYEATGAIPREWYNKSILSRTLCRSH